MSKSPASSHRRLVTIGQAAAYASVNPRTIRRRISDGSLTGYRLGPRIIRINLNELDDILTPIPTVGNIA